MKSLFLIWISFFSLTYAGTMSVETDNETKTYNLEEIHSITFDIPAGPEMVAVQGGTFVMGDRLGVGYGDELPSHQVTLSSFSMGKYEITQAEYQSVMGHNPAVDSNHGVGDNYPVYYVNWYDAIAYCNALSASAGLEQCYTVNGTDVSCDFTKNGYRLPTEAEWEYAARGGIHNGDNLCYPGCHEEDDLINYTWYSTEVPLSTSYEVGTKLPNQTDIYDLAGNVYEWCWDWSGAYSSGAETNPTGPFSGSNRVIRGGSWYNYASALRVSYRSGYAPANDLYRLGFRVVKKTERSSDK